MARLIEGVRRHRGEDLSLAHAAQGAVAEIGRGGLDRVDRAVREVKGHGPVVRDGVDDMGHARVDSGLRRPDVCRDEGRVPGDVAVDGRHELRHLLVRDIVGELAEALAVERVPDEFVEKLILLRPARAHRVQVVLVADDLAAGALTEGVEVHPNGLIAEGIRRRSHRHRDAVVAEAHADVADDDGFVRELRRWLVGEREALHVPERPDDRRVLEREMVGRLAVVAELADILVLILFGLFQVLFGDGVIENTESFTHGFYLRS